MIIYLLCGCVTERGGYACSRSSTTAVWNIFPPHIMRIVLLVIFSCVCLCLEAQPCEPWGGWVSCICSYLDLSVGLLALNATWWNSIWIQIYCIYMYTGSPRVTAPALWWHPSHLPILHCTLYCTWGRQLLHSYAVLLRILTPYATKLVDPRNL